LIFVYYLSQAHLIDSTLFSPRLTIGKKKRNPSTEKFQKVKSETTASLAQSITRTGSKQTYYTARLLVDKDLVSDFFRVYAYFRWTDDVVDKSSQTREERVSFIKQQRDLIDQLYHDERSDSLGPEEVMLAELISNDRGENSGLESFIRNMLAIIEFDAYRKLRVISNHELTWYSNRLAQSVTDGLQYFIGNDHAYPMTEHRYKAATAAHIVHLLRDTLQDTEDGIINIPQEYLEKNDIGPEDIHCQAYRVWVQQRVDLARVYFREGKRYLDSLEVLRCKIMGYWYCARFEGILDIIERDGYVLRADYKNHLIWLKMLWLGILVTFQHIFS
jgi:phytoene/squalene synthetase